MSERDALSGRAAQLRAELDASFARPRELARPELAPLLAIRVGEDGYALRMSDAQALLADRPITRVPTPVPELIGLCAIRGAIAPVYDLGALLGLRTPRLSPPRWLVLAKHPELIALAFDALDAQLLVPVAEIAPPASGSEHDGAVRVHGELRPLIKIASVLEAIERRLGPPQEP